MTFEEDLTKRRIDVAAFAAGDPEKFNTWKLLYQQVHPNSFYTSVKMVINDVRRRFWLQEAPKPAAAPATASSKPIIKRTGAVPSTASAIPDEPSPSVDRTPEVAPAPKGRAVIRRPVVGTPTLPIESATPPEENTPAPETTPAATEPPKPGRARPVFRKPAGEPREEASTEKKTEPESKPVEAPNPENSSPETPKPARPRPVFRKPTPPAASIAPADSTLEPEASATSAEIPEHTNPNPEEAPKPPRPRPVFKRPTPPTSEITVEPNAQEPRPEPGPEVDANPAPLASEAPKFPRPRPVIKRPAAPATQAAPEQTEVKNTIPDSAAGELAGKPENVAPDPVITLPANELKEINSEKPAELQTPKPQRPRPVFKRPAKPEPPEGSPGNQPDQA